MGAVNIAEHHLKRSVADNHPGRIRLLQMQCRCRLILRQLRLGTDVRGAGAAAKPSEFPVKVRGFSLIFVNSDGQIVCTDRWFLGTLVNGALFSDENGAIAADSRWLS